MHWITSAGGPLLLLDARELDHWGGVVDEIEDWPDRESYSPDGFPTDYDRACCIGGYLGKILVTDVEALVVAEEPLPTTWVPSATAGTIVSCVTADSYDPSEDWLDKIPKTAFKEECLFSVAGPSLILFDSALAGRNVKNFPGEYLEIEMAPARYKVKTAVYEPDAQTSMVVHRFELD